MNSLKSPLLITALVLTAATPAWATIVLDFEDPFLATAQAGNPAAGPYFMPTLSEQYNTSAFGNLVISSFNGTDFSSGPPPLGIATIYDTNGGFDATGTARPDGILGGDDDLERRCADNTFNCASSLRSFPGGGNAAETDIGNIVITQENGGTQLIDGVEYLTEIPDDIVGSTIVFEWGVDLAQLQFYAVDAEATETTSGSHIEFFRNGVFVSQFSYADFDERQVYLDAVAADSSQTIVWGDKTNNFILPFTAAEIGGLFDEVRFVFNGSGAVGDLTVVVNPEPGTILLLLSGIAMVAWKKRSGWVG